MKKSKLRVLLPELVREMQKDLEAPNYVKWLDVYSAILTRLFEITLLGEEAEQQAVEAIKEFLEARRRWEIEEHIRPVFSGLSFEEGKELLRKWIERSYAPDRLSLRLKKIVETFWVEEEKQ
jgi:hypothetical protein